MPRWEFHLCPDETRNAARWVWLYRYDEGDSITSATSFGSYGECICDALLHGYQTAGTPRYSGQALAGSPRLRPQL